MTSLQVAIRRLDDGLPLPAYAAPGDAGLDLHARVDVHLRAGERVLVPTGVALEIPDGWVGLVHPRSGLAHRHGITVLNAPGTIDAGYRGEICVNLINLDPRADFEAHRGDRIAQLVVQRVAQVQWVETDELAGSVRGERGHGSTGGFRSGHAAATDHPETKD